METRNSSKVYYSNKRIIGHCIDVVPGLYEYQSCYKLSNDGVPFVTSSTPISVPLVWTLLCQYIDIVSHGTHINHFCALGYLIWCFLRRTSFPFSKEDLDKGQISEAMISCTLEDIEQEHEGDKVITWDEGIANLNDCTFECEALLVKTTSYYQLKRLYMSSYFNTVYNFFTDGNTQLHRQIDVTKMTSANISAALKGYNATVFENVKFIWNELEQHYFPYCLTFYLDPKQLCLEHVLHIDRDTYPFESGFLVYHFPSHLTKLTRPGAAHIHTNLHTSTESMKLHEMFHIKHQFINYLQAEKVCESIHRYDIEEKDDINDVNKVNLTWAPKKKKQQAKFSPYHVPLGAELDVD